MATAAARKLAPQATRTTWPEAAERPIASSNRTVSSACSAGQQGAWEPLKAARKSASMLVAGASGDDLLAGLAGGLEREGAVGGAE